MDKINSTAESFSSNASNFHLFQLKKLLRSLEKLFDDVQSVDEAVEAFKNKMFLKIPRFGFLVSLEIGGKFALEFPKCGSEFGEDFQGDQNFVQSFFNFNLKPNITLVERFRLELNCLQYL